MDAFILHQDPRFILQQHTLNDISFHVVPYFGISLMLQGQNMFFQIQSVSITKRGKRSTTVYNTKSL